MDPNTRKTTLRMIPYGLYVLTAAHAFHLLGGVSGWGFPYSEKGSVTLTVRLHYAGGRTEDHPLVNGEHFADYIRKVDVPKSEFAFALRSQQIRYLAIQPKSIEVITAAVSSDSTSIGRGAFFSSTFPFLSSTLRMKSGSLRMPRFASTP